MKIMSTQSEKKRIIESVEAEIIQAIAKKAKRLRQERGLSSEAFANMNKINRITYYKFESGVQNFNIVTLIKVIKGLEISMPDFFSTLE